MAKNTRTMVNSKGEIFDIPLDKVKEAAESQGLEFTVPFVNQKGEIFDIPKSRAEAATSSGLKAVQMSEPKGDYEQKQERPAPTYTESGARGVAQGITFGQAPKIAAVAESLFSNKTYKDALAESEENFTRAERANPLVYNAGQVGGTVASILVPGGLAAKGIGAAATGTGTAARVAQGSILAGKDAAMGVRAIAAPVGRVAYKIATNRGVQTMGGAGVGGGVINYLMNKTEKTVMPAVEKFTDDITE